MKRYAEAGLSSSGAVSLAAQALSSLSLAAQAQACSGVLAGPADQRRLAVRAGLSMQCAFSGSRCENQDGVAAALAQFAERGGGLAAAGRQELPAPAACAADAHEACQPSNSREHGAASCAGGMAALFAQASSQGLWEMHLGLSGNRSSGVRGAASAGIREASRLGSPGHQLNGLLSRQADGCDADR